MKKFFLLGCFLTSMSCAAKLFATIRLPPIMSSNMVLQQNSQATLWGWADPSERFTITCSWKTTVDSVTAFNSGQWKAKIGTPAAGGPYSIVLKSRINTIVLANIALAETYKKPIPVPNYKSPVYKRMETDKEKINLYFDNAPNGFMVKGDGSPTEFLIAGSDQNFLPADVKLEKDRIVVSNKQIAHPVAVRFSFSNTGMSNVYNKEGLPVTPFRTDSWEVIPVKQP